MIADAPPPVRVAPPEPKLTRVTVAELLAEIQRHPSPSWGPAIEAVLGKHIGEVIAP